MSGLSDLYDFTPEERAEICRVEAMRRASTAMREANFVSCMSRADAEIARTEVTTMPRAANLTWGGETLPPRRNRALTSYASARLIASMRSPLIPERIDSLIA